MSRRRDFVVAAAAATALVVVAFATGRRGRAADDTDPRASSFLAGREGTRALADAAEHLGVDVVRWRRRPQALDSAWSGRAATLAVLAPSVAVSEAERDEIVRWPLRAGGGALVVVGASAHAIMRCFGYRVESSVFDSSRVVVPAVAGASGAAPPDGDATWVHAHLAADTTEREAAPEAGAPRDSRGQGRRRRSERLEASCPVVLVAATDTLLRDEAGASVLVQLTVAGRRHRVLLGADDALVRNRSLRRGAAAAIVAAAVVPRAGVLIFDEYHHGFAPGGSMAAVALAWSARHPLGWMVWQLILVGLVALAASAWRFGPVRAAISRRRRDGREHVRALATALAAAEGHREAVAALVRGLRRRLSPAAPSGGGAAPADSRNPAARPRDDWRPWLQALEARAPSAGARDAARRLLQLADHSGGDSAVVEAAHAVDALWDALRPAPRPS
jgi:hypothetical protein